MFLYCVTAFAFAQEVQLNIDNNQIIVGVPTVLTVLATGFEEEPAPEVGEWSIQGRNRGAVQVDFLGVDPMVSRQTSIINGRRSDTVNVRYAYRYRLMVDKEGDYQIPTIQVTQGDVYATSRPGRFKVTEAPMTPEMAIELEIPSTTVWVGQTISLNIDVYLQRDIGDLNVVVPLFDEFPVQPSDTDTTTQQFTLTTVHGDIDLPIVQERVRKGNQEYTRIRMMAETTLTKAGNIDVPPSRILANMVVGQQRGRLGFSRSQYQLFQAKDTRKTLEVRPLPLKDKPDSFSGAVGESFSMVVRANKTVVAVGEPIPIEVEVRGKGTLDGIQLPDFESLGLDERVFETPTQPPLGIENDEGGKVFSFSVRLKSSDVREIPTLDFGYFDPSKGSYHHAYTQPIALAVSGSKVVSSAEVISSGTTSTTVSTTREESLSTSNFELSWHTDSSNQLATLPWLEITLGVHGVAFLGWMVFGWRERTKDIRAEQSSKKQSKRALEKLLPNLEKAAAAEVSSDLSTTLKKYGNEYDVSVSDIIQQIEIESYSPSAKTRPLSDSLREMIKGILVLLCTVCVLHTSPARAEVVHVTGFETDYRTAMAMTSYTERRTAMLQLQHQLQRYVVDHSEDASAWVNLGTVSIQVSDRGRAVLAYSKAQELGTKSSLIEDNLEELENQLPSWAQKNTSSVWTDVLFWTTLSTSVQWIGLNILGIILLLGMRRWKWARVLIVPWFGLATGLMLGWLDMQEPVVVIMESAPLRTADHAQAPLVRNDWLPTGTHLKVLQTQEAWVQIELSSGVQGWLPVKDIERL